jgi:phage gpG-like protein
MIRIDVNDSAVQATLRMLQARLQNPQPALDAVGQQLTEGVRQHIKDGQDWQGQPFAPNSPLTIARKGSSKPLIDSGNMAALRLYHRATATEVVVGNSAIQAAVLQFGAKQGAFGRSKRGGPLPWGDIPARPYLPITPGGDLAPSARDVVVQTLMDYLADAA